MLLLCLKLLIFVWKQHSSLGSTTHRLPTQHGRSFNDQCIASAISMIACLQEHRSFSLTFSRYAVFACAGPLLNVGVRDTSDSLCVTVASLLLQFDSNCKLSFTFLSQLFYFFIVCWLCAVTWCWKCFELLLFIQTPCAHIEWIHLSSRYFLSSILTAILYKTL